jgi:hypothetical protein
MATKSYTAIVEKEGTGYVALCPELDVASQVRGIWGQILFRASSIPWPFALQLGMR